MSCRTYQLNGADCSFVWERPAILNILLIAILTDKANCLFFVESLQEHKYHRGVHLGQLCLLTYTPSAGLLPGARH